jgi:3-oxoacyl-[acyl-carrier-protein] synthase-3
MKILGTGSELPKTVVTNDDLAQVMDTSDEWIKSRTGIEQRHIAVQETTTSLAVEAAKAALKEAKLSIDELDLIIAGTVSPDYLFPTLACEVQAAIGAKRATAFDLSAGCSGFLFALATADAYFQTGRFKNALVIGAEVLSKMVDWSDRSTCVLFGDGAGAAVVSADGDQLLSMVQGSDGAGGMALKCDNRPVNNLYRQLGAQHYAFTEMNGQEVYRFAVRTVPQAISEALEQAKVPADEVSYFILHQANLRIIESVAKRLHQPMEKFPTNLQECGNISAASVPVLLDKVRKEGLLKTGDKIVLAGFGAGLTWGACVIEW